MLSQFGCALRALVVTAILCGAIAPGSAHEGHDHDEQQQAVSPGALPRGGAVSNEFEIVAVARGETLEIYLDRFATNEPVTDATLEAETPSGPAKATQDTDGTYRMAAPWLAKSGRTDLIFTVTAGGGTDILPLTIEIPSTRAEDTVREDATGGAINKNVILLVMGGVLAGAFMSAIALRGGRRAATLGVIFVLLTGARAARAHEDHGHEEEKAQIAISTTSGERAQRLPDGVVFAPKTVQRIFALRTLVAEKEVHRKVTELPGRIIPDPNASGYVQSAVGGRLSAAPGGFPRLGTRVKQGDILGYVTPPLQAIDVSDMRQRQGELDQQISIVERRFARYEQLAPSGAISRSQLDDTRLELEGLRERRASIEKSRRDPEALIAPVAGVIAEGNPVAGQIVQPSSVVFNIIDPAQLWVEALSFENIEPQSARASTYTGKSFGLVYRGAGFADRSQSVPVHFAVSGDTAGLRAGQFLTVFVATDEAKEGLAVPRTSIVRGSNGQDLVYEHVAPERFMARSVRTEPLDGDRVLIVSGLGSGKRIVSQGADLLDHVR
jgi:cobalt-zinc-cadmium efflux system membrane fusion protein